MEILFGDFFCELFKPWEELNRTKCHKTGFGVTQKLSVQKVNPYFGGLAQEMQPMSQVAVAR
ncbi:hypothetical protein [Pleionea sp. CnH1-48]|uniref:hypothetical protein n=1 Tax=Pleionea sp. CnH1-48 TaxID=2954494 RepID=UPI002097AD46|nr:hypothetical protein [Pleionea sp. CnH1-48]MCO7222742.1 hypothetical protein [Pleionea sp. CnH1-48]